MYNTLCGTQVWPTEVSTLYGLLLAPAAQMRPESMEFCGGAIIANFSL